jgi:hypothetical protein
MLVAPSRYAPSWLGWNVSAPFRSSDSGDARSMYAPSGNACDGANDAKAA